MKRCKLDHEALRIELHAKTMPACPCPSCGEILTPFNPYVTQAEADAYFAGTSGLTPDELAEIQKANITAQAFIDQQVEQVVVHADDDSQWEPPIDVLPVGNPYVSNLYDAARIANHSFGFPWTDPRTGLTHQPDLTYRLVMLDDNGAVAGPGSTVAVLDGENRLGIKCLFCDSVSWSLGDVENIYCGRCHLFHNTVALVRRMVAERGTHECSEWRTFKNVCAICGTRLTPREPL